MGRNACEGTGIRTRDTRLKRAVLYLLSYALKNKIRNSKF